MTASARKLLRTLGCHHALIPMKLSPDDDLPARPFLPPRRRLRAGAVWLSALLLQVFSLVTLPLSARALTATTRDFEGLVARAETIFKGTVYAQESFWRGEGPNRHIATRVTFQVLATYKGVSASSQTLEFLGGTLEGRSTRVPGAPQFAVGETAVLFVVGNGEQFCPLVGAFQGRFVVERDPATAEERVYRHDRRPVSDTGAIGREGEAETVSSHGGATTPRSAAAAEPPNAPALTATQFGAAIAEKLRERRAQGLPEVQRD